MASHYNGFIAPWRFSPFSCRFSCFFHALCDTRDAWTRLIIQNAINILTSFSFRFSSRFYFSRFNFHPTGSGAGHIARMRFITRSKTHQLRILFWSTYIFILICFRVHSFDIFICSQILLAFNSIQFFINSLYNEIQTKPEFNSEQFIELAGQKKIHPTTIHSSQWTERARPISPKHGTSAEMKECPTQSVTHRRHNSFSAAIIHSAATHLCGNNGVRWRVALGVVRVLKWHQAHGTWQILTVYRALRTYVRRSNFAFRDTCMWGFVKLRCLFWKFKNNMSLFWVWCLPKILRPRFWFSIVSSSFYWFFFNFTESVHVIVLTWFNWNLFTSPQSILIKYFQKKF